MGKNSIEAIAPGTSPEAKAAAKRRGVFFDAVNKVRDPNFYLWLDHLGEGMAPPASARLRAELRGWLAQLDPDDFNDLATAPTRHWEHNAWSATFRAVPKRVEARGVRNDDRAIGIYGHTGAAIVDDAPAIRNALAAKHRAYGTLGAPFIIVLGTYIHDHDRWHSTNALYGYSAVQLEERPDGETITRAIRQPDGYFGAPPAWNNGNVSGVLLVNQLMPYYVHRAETTLWLHPDPLYPLAADTGLTWEVVQLRGTRLDETAAGRSAREFFELPDPWPPGEGRSETV